MELNFGKDSEIHTLILLFDTEKSIKMYQFKSRKLCILSLKQRWKRDQNNAAVIIVQTISISLMLKTCNSQIITQRNTM